MKKYALITGASSGIGREIARLFAQRGYNIVVVARRVKLLNELQAECENGYNINVEIIEADLADISSHDKILKELKKKQIIIDYLVNNAGFGGHGKFHERNWENYQNMINVNVMALTSLTHKILPQMVERNYGRILNISSTAAFLPGPFQAVYYATKAYVNSFTQAINEELSDKDIWATAFCPTATDTEFTKVGNLTETKLFKGKKKNALQVAQKALQTLDKKRHVYIDSAYEAFGFRFVFPLLSRKMILKMSRRYMETN